MLSRTPKTPAPPPASSKFQTPATLTGSPLALPADDTGPNTSHGEPQQPNTASGPHTPAMNLSFRGSDLGVSLKEQTRAMEDLKKENFAMKLQINELQTRLTRMSPVEVQRAMAEHDQLVVKQEAMASEIRTYKELLFEAQHELDQLRTIAAGAKSGHGQDEDLARAREENEALQTALLRSQSSIRTMKEQLSMAEEEARQATTRARQLEMELASANRRLSEAVGKVEAQSVEIADLTEQVRQREDLAARARHDYTGTAAELHSLTRQIGELQSALRRSEAERSDLQLKLSVQGQHPPSSPSDRSSIDAIESRLMRELGAATKKLSDMEKKTHISASERDQLLYNLNSNAEALNTCMSCIQSCVQKLAQHTPNLVPSTSHWDQNVKDATALLDQMVAQVSEELTKDKESLRGGGTGTDRGGRCD